MSDTMGNNDNFQHMMSEQDDDYEETPMYWGDPLKGESYPDYYERVLSGPDEDEDAREAELQENLENQRATEPEPGPDYSGCVTWPAIEGE